MSDPDVHTLTPDEWRKQIVVTRRRRTRTDRVTSNAADLTNRLAEINDHPDHVIERLRAIIQGG